MKSLISECFGSLVFSNDVMKKKLSDSTYKKFISVLSSGESLTKELAGEIASAMKEWAIEKGATHYTHWFQPLTGFTAEKHDSFLSLDKEGKPIIEFSAKQLIKGETDASSFPSGGARATFEARGYTVWDCSSPAFIKYSENGTKVLCIPTAFCSYTGDALDKKTPLLKALEALNREGLRVLRLLGDKETKKIYQNLGAEQEYFLIDKKDFFARDDVKFTGRTLFGAMPPKGQEKEDQYYANIKERVASFMADLNVELWRVGIASKTQHNEVAPAQHELAAIYSNTNIATDQNQLIMEIMKRVAEKHNLSCLLHEKPFMGVNGSGKHNNVSFVTDTGRNLLKPGADPENNLEFLIFFTAVIAGVDEYAELVRLSAAHAGNDHRLGANEAPPAIISVFTDEMFLSVLEDIEKHTKTKAKEKDNLKMGVSHLPLFSKDFADRNRTSPFAFTGDKFEFRMVGSSASTSTPNVVLSTITAEMLSRIADELEKVPEKDRSETGYNLVAEMFTKHKKVIFNGNNYTILWEEEAKKRGLPNIKNSVDAYKYLTEEKSVKLFEKHGVFKEKELTARREIYYENYAKTLNIEALTMLQMSKTQILPACIKYEKSIAESFNQVVKAGGKGVAQKGLLENLEKGITAFYDNLVALESALKMVDKGASYKTQAEGFRDYVLPAMSALRSVADYLETITEKEVWPFPTYSDILFYN